MEKLRDNISKIRKRCNESGLNHFKVELSIVDELWWFKVDDFMKFEHWTGSDNEIFDEGDEFYNNTYIQEKINSNIVDILHHIDKKAHTKKENSIKGL